MNEQTHQIELIKAQAKVELGKMEANSPAKDVAICNVAWTPEVIAAYKAQQEANQLGK